MNRTTTKSIDNADNEAYTTGQSNQRLTKTIDQSNLCVGGSNSQNNGSNDNQQSNLCANGLDCKNSGINDNTMRANGSNCENTGKDTKVFASGGDCSSGPDGTIKLCVSGGRSVTLGGGTTPTISGPGVGDSNTNTNTNKNDPHRRLNYINNSYRGIGSLDRLSRCHQSVM